jgi:hypothetical protein
LLSNTLFHRQSSAQRETPLSKPVKAAILASKLPRLANVG